MAELKEKTYNPRSGRFGGGVTRREVSWHRNPSNYSDPTQTTIRCIRTMEGERAKDAIDCRTADEEYGWLRRELERRPIQN